MGKLQRVNELIIINKHPLLWGDVALPTEFNTWILFMISQYVQKCSQETRRLSC